MTVVGHGSDGCSYSLFVEDADKNTRITAINSELVCTRTAEPVRSYVLMGKEPNTKNVDPNARLILYNTAFWGSPTIGAIINAGTVRFQQANFQRSGAPAIDNRGGKVNVYSSYFAQRMMGEATGTNVYVKQHAAGVSTELTNNSYISGFTENNESAGKIYGSDIDTEKKGF
jgi:hypothetical protein